MRKRANGWIVAAALAAGLACGSATGQPPATFVGKPAIVKEKDGVRIDFALSAPGDVEVGIVDACGKVINHLAAGVLGGKYAPPEPLKEGLAQSLVWDGKDDHGSNVNVEACSVRLRLGVKPVFAWTTGKYPAQPVIPNHPPWIKLKAGANISGPWLNNRHVVADVPAFCPSNAMCAYVDAGSGRGDKGMMVALRKEGDVFFAERDANEAAAKAYITKFNYADTGAKMTVEGQAYSIYKVHGKAGDRFYRTPGCMSDNGVLYGFWFADPSILYTPADDPAYVDPQSDFLVSQHRLLGGDGGGGSAEIVTDADRSLDQFYLPKANWGVGNYQSFDCMSATNGKALWSRKLQYKAEDFRKFPNADTGFGGHSALFDARRGIIDVFCETATSIPPGDKIRGALLRFNHADGSPLPWPETKSWWVADVSKGDAQWAGGGKGIALGLDGTIYINTKSNKTNKFGPLVVRVVKDGVIVDPGRIRVDAAFGNIKVDRKGNIYVGVNLYAKDGSWADDMDTNSLKQAEGYANLGAIRNRSGSILKFPNSGGRAVEVPASAKDYDYIVPYEQRKVKAEQAPTWAWFGYMNCPTTSSCWCPWGSFDMDGWGRLYVPRTYEAGLVIIDSNRNLVHKLRNRDVTDEMAVPGFGMIPNHLGVTDNYLVVGDALPNGRDPAFHGFRLDAQVTLTLACNGKTRE